jgi:hypothetical protein
MATERVNPYLAQDVGKQDQGSRSKADKAKERTNDQVAQASPDSWPRGVNGNPMQKIVMTASELIPTGQYANVSVGPAQITAFVDSDKELELDDDGHPLPYFSAEQRATIAQAMNELAEIVEVDVIAVQRNLVLENLQEHVQNGK